MLLEGEKNKGEEAAIVLLEKNFHPQASLLLRFPNGPSWLWSGIWALGFLRLHLPGPGGELLIVKLDLEPVSDRECWEPLSSALYIIPFH